jgi:hypothetical protein
METETAVADTTCTIFLISSVLDNTKDTSNYSLLVNGTLSAADSHELYFVANSSYFPFVS